ncbi:MAG: Ig domain-containing protein [Acidobacteriota bacterium]
MIARRCLLLIVLLAVACGSAWGQIGPFTITPTSIPAGGGVFTVNQAIPLQQFSPNPNLDASFSWSVSSGLPPGLVFNPSFSTITGTPTLPGAFTFTVSAVEGNSPYSASQQYTVYVSTGSPLSLTLVTPSPPGGAAGNNYASFTGTVSGGVPGYTWSLQGGANVDGLTLNPTTGLLSGIPQAGGVFPVGITVTDAAGTKASVSFNLSVLGIAAPPLAAGVIAVPYLQSLTAVGATGPVTWSPFGTLPPGLNLTPQGQISGTPTALGTYPFQVRVTDTATRLVATQSFSISVTSALRVTTTSPLPNATIGAAYSQTLQAVGGTTPYAWSATGLPAWLTLNQSTGVLSGTPTVGGTSTIAVTVTDAASGTATASLSLTVGALVISPATLPTGFVNVAYPATPGSATLTVAGATVANWAVSAGTLPAGLTLNASTGVISGKPTTAGNSAFTITASVTGAAGVPPVIQQFTLLVNAGPAVVISGLPAIGVAATQPSATVSLSGGTYSLNLTGTLTLAFVPAGGGTGPFDAKFASGPPSTASFTIPAGASTGQFGAASSVPVMTGTVAGTITITTALQDSNGSPVAPPAPIVMTINPTVPVITKVTFGTIANGAFTISVTGRSTPRDMTSALFHFALPTNTQPSTLDVTVPLTTAFAAWYGSSASGAFGSTFTATFQFTFSGPPGSTVPFTAVTVTMTNSVGASNPFGPSSP